MARRTAAVESFRGSTAAINTPDSMSGMLALKVVVAPHAVDRRFFGRVLYTGSHANSLQAVRDGDADICAVDAVTAALLRRHRPQLFKGMHEITRSPKVPGLPYITRTGDPDRIRTAMNAVMQDRSLSPAREVLLLKNITVLDVGAYELIADFERRMQSHQGVRLS
jgi:ABC-type phosphate/phosphonate transport system substrate-binding protein